MSSATADDDPRVIEDDQLRDFFEISDELVAAAAATDPLDQQMGKLHRESRT